MKIRKLSLETIKIQSFVTELSYEKKKTIMGGVETDPVECNEETIGCPTQQVGCDSGTGTTGNSVVGKRQTKAQTKSV